jgi:hypothetical protein
MTSAKEIQALTSAATHLDGCDKPARGRVSVPIIYSSEWAKIATKSENRYTLCSAIADSLTNDAKLAHALTMLLDGITQSAWENGLDAGFKAIREAYKK